MEPQPYARPEDQVGTITDSTIRNLKKFSARGTSVGSPEHIFKPNIRNVVPLLSIPKKIKKTECYTLGLFILFKTTRS